MRDQITLRIEWQHAIQLGEMATATGLSINRVAAALLERALDEGWTVTPPGRPGTALAPQTSGPGGAPTARPAGPGPAPANHPEG